ncbi:MAG: T9SS type A sorting domain-containing protein, partial [Saprospiraceae bacterium]
NNINAHHNQYASNDSSAIACKIYDYYDNVSSGYIYWQPFDSFTNATLENIPPTDLCEPAFATWDKYVADGLSTTLSWDNVDFQSGISSLKCITKSGFEVRLHYNPSNNHVASWNLSQVQFIHISFKADNPSANGFQINEIRFGNDCGDYFSYKNLPATAFTPVWTNYIIPLKGNTKWALSVNGNVTWQHITYAEVIADTWDYGFTLWTDGFYFDPLPTLINEVTDNSFSVNCFPNPATNFIHIQCNNLLGVKTKIKISTVLGTEILSTEIHGEDNTINVSEWPNGIYFINVSDGKKQTCKKLIVEHN